MASLVIVVSAILYSIVWTDTYRYTETHTHRQTPMNVLLLRLLSTSVVGTLHTD